MRRLNDVEESRFLSMCRGRSSFACLELAVVQRVGEGISCKYRTTCPEAELNDRNIGFCPSGKGPRFITIGLGDNVKTLAGSEKVFHTCKKALLRHLKCVKGQEIHSNTYVVTTTQPIAAWKPVPQPLQGRMGAGELRG